jgi:branched-chain amino acid aminotransferase
MERCINQFFIYEGEVLKNIDFNETMVSSGKSIYEVIRVIDGVPLFLEKHLERLMNSVRISNLTLSLNASDIEKNILKLIEINEASEGNVKIVFNYVNDVNNKFIAYFINHNYPTVEQYENGVRAILFQGERNNPNAKIINLDFRNIVDREIKEKNVYEAILVDREGNVTEGSKSNIFMVKGNTVITAPKGLVLPGITRESILDVCINLGIEVKEQKVNFEDLRSMDGVFISGTSPKVLPVSDISSSVHFNTNNKIILSIMKAYDEKIENYIENHKI